MNNKDLKLLISNRIKNLRIRKNMTSERLAYRSGISKGGLSEIERNMKEPRLLTIIKICAGLEISVKEFFDFEEIETFSSSI